MNIEQTNQPSPPEENKQESSEKPQDSGSPNNRNPRNWLKVWGSTATLFAGGWCANYFLDAKNDKALSDVAAEVQLDEEIGKQFEQLLLPRTGDQIELDFPGEDFAKRLTDSGDLKKEAFQFAENGIFSYQFQSKTSPVNWVEVRGLQAGADNNNFIKDLKAAGVQIRIGEDVRDNYQLELQAKIEAIRAERENMTDLHNSLRKITGWLIILGVGMHIARSIRSAKGFGFTMPGMDGFKGDTFSSKPKEGFDHIGGLKAVLPEFLQMKKDIELVKSGDKKVKISKGILLHGPSGTGKTMLARAVAAETDCPFVSFKGSDLTAAIFVGSGVARIKEAWANARRLRDEQTKELRAAGNPDAEGVCILFIDEFDSLGRSRGFKTGHHSNGEDTKEVNSVLAEMDNVDKQMNKNIIVMAATNDLEGLDDAVTRPGRFSKTIEIPKPRTKSDRLDVLRKVMKNQFEPDGYHLDSPEVLEKIASVTPRMSAADLMGILSHSVDIVRREQRVNLTFDDIIEGFQQQTHGLKALELPEHDEREQTAWHELHGHALIGLACGINSYVISMQPRGDSLGHVILDPDAISETAPTKKELLHRILVLSAGYAAEEKRYGELGTTTGAAQDIEEVQKIMKLMMSTGLIGDMFSRSFHKESPQNQKLTAKQSALIDQAALTAIQTSKQIIECVPVDTLERMVAESLALDKELIGDRAIEFFGKHIDKETRDRMQSVVQNYLKDPLVSKINEVADSATA